jgi:ABC-type uncharacterized transport system permease subunit
VAHALHKRVESGLGTRALLRPKDYVQVRRRSAMLYTIAVVLLILWLLGLVTGYTIGAFIHVLVVIAIVLFLVGLLTGRRVV